MNKDYLKDDKEAIEKVKQFIESGQKENIRLAIKLIEGAEVAQELLTHLFAVTRCYPDEEEIRAPAMALCMKVPGFPKFYLGNRFFLYSSTEEMVISCKEYLAIDAHLLAKLIYLHTGELATYCLEHRLLPAREIIAQTMDYPTILSFANMNLSYLPPEVGLFTNVTFLNIEGNTFSNIPDEIQNLAQLNMIEFGDTPLSDKAIKKLAVFFPVIMANYYDSLASNASFDEDILKDYNLALKYQEKAISLDPSLSSYWQTKAKLLRKLGRYEEALEAINTGLKTCEKYQKTDAQYRLASLYTTQGIIYLYLQQYNVSHEAFDKALAADSSHSEALYNKACTYALEHKKTEMLDYLHQAIFLDQDFRKQADNDYDFSNYREDKDFLALVKGNEQ